MISTRDTRRWCKDWELGMFQGWSSNVLGERINVLGEQQREFAIRCGSDLREGKFAVGMNRERQGRWNYIWKTGNLEPIAKLYLGLENIVGV